MIIPGKVGANIVLPKIGSNYESLLTLVNILKKNNYKVHLTLIELDRIKATQRALYRFEKTGRYVPLGLIFDTYNNSPNNAFYKTVTLNSKLLDSYGVISTDVSENKSPIKASNKLKKTATKDKTAHNTVYN